MFEMAMNRFHQLDFEPLRPICQQLAQEYEVQSERIVFEFLRFLLLKELEYHHNDGMSHCPTSLIARVWYEAATINNEEFYKGLLKSMNSYLKPEHHFQIPFEQNLLSKSNYPIRLAYTLGYGPILCLAKSCRR